MLSCSACRITIPTDQKLQVASARGLRYSNRMEVKTMSVDVKDMMLDKVAIGPVSARVYQGAEFAKGPPIVLFFGGGAFLDQGLRDCPVAECLASIGAIVVVPDYIAPLGSAFPKPLEVGFSIF